MSYNNHFLFSETYIKNLIGDMKKPEKEECKDTFENIHSWYQEYKSSWELFEDVVLDTLAFTKELDEKYRILFSDNNEKVAVAYLLDADTNLKAEVKGKYYAADVIKKAKAEGVEWVIVANGYDWRLYNAVGISPYEFYFGVNIFDELQSGKASEGTEVFIKLFSAKTFYHTEKGLKIDAMKEESNAVEENVEDILRSKAEDILTNLCYGLKDNMHKEVFSEIERKQIYDDAIILLYRLLFLGYAEARKLLPVVDGDPEYKDSFSELCKTARAYKVGGRLPEMAEEFDLWDRLDSQLRIYVDKNYNGGLFSNEDKPILKEYRISNRQLADCLVELSYISGKKNDYAQNIEYKDLSVRNLGAIYEGLLEYQLFIAEERMVRRKSKENVVYYKASDVKLVNNDLKNLLEPGQIYLSQDAMERKETGAYYTPEDVVEYIVNNTVGKKLGELKEQFAKEISEFIDKLSYEPVEANRKLIQMEIDEKTLEFIEEKVLGLSIIDSAMGSGHFLVNATYKVANFIVDLIEENAWENDEIHAEIGYWKRRVVENCIYGIDINNLSVLLARLSLWLISASNNKALSFIDHHLKCGNSIVGTSLKKVQNYDKKYPILTVTYEQYMRGIVRKYEEMKSIGSDTKADVELQHRLYDEINQELSVVKRKLDYYLASQYAGGITDSFEYHNVLTNSDMVYFEHQQFAELFKFADDNHFYHWELEFPEVFMDGGFDVAIGNPPYVEVSSEAFKTLGLSTITTTNLYPYMIEVTCKYTKHTGAIGYIVPLSGFYTPRMKPFSDFLGERFTIWLSNFGVRPSKIFKNAEQRIAIFFGFRGNSTNTIFTTAYNRWNARDRKNLFRNLHYVEQNINNHLSVIPKMGNIVEKEILRKIYETDRTIGDYLQTSSENVIYFHGAARYWLKSLNFLPTFYNEKKGASRSSEWKEIHFSKDVDINVIICLINSSLFFWYWILMSDERHFSKRDITQFPFDYAKYQPYEKHFDELSVRLMDDYSKNSLQKEINTSQGITRYQEFYPRMGKNILDEIDKIVGKVICFTDNEIDFIINNDLKFRMGEEGEQ